MITKYMIIYKLYIYKGYTQFCLGALLMSSTQWCRSGGSVFQSNGAVLRDWCC